jgi:hypothetical protein
MAKVVESITAAKRKKVDPYEAWQGYDTLTRFDDGKADLKMSAFSNNKKRSIDTIESTPKDTLDSSASSNTQLVESPKSRFSASNIIKMGEQVWNWFCTPITFSRDSTNTTGKPAGSGTIQPIGGAPTLTTPEALINQEMVQKLLHELKEQSSRISETLHETDEEIRGDERRFLKCFLEQIKLKEEKIEVVKYILIFDQQTDRSVRKQQNNSEEEISEINKKQKKWGYINTGATVISVGVVVAMVAVGIFSGIAGAAVPVAFQIATTGIQIPLALTSGFGKIMKTKWDSEHNLLQGKTLLLKQRHIQINFRIKDEVNLMKDSYDQVLKSVEMRNRLAKTMNETIKFVLSK